MSRVIVSTSYLCLSRQQEEFLAKYRSESAKKEFLQSYGVGDSDFLSGGYGKNSNRPLLADVLEYFSYYISNGNVFFDLEFNANNPNLVIHAGFRVNEVFPSSAGRILFGTSRIPGNITIIPNLVYAVGSNMFSLMLCLIGGTPYWFGVPEGLLFNKLDISLNGIDRTLSVNEKTIKVNPSSQVFTDGNFWLFSNNSSTSIPCDFFYLKVYESGNLIRNLIPVSKDGEVCLFDFVQRRFYYNKGTGTLVAGPIVGVSKNI